jgi:hypothetical protein
MSHAPFNTSLRRDPGQPRDLIARVDAEVQNRIAEAVDFVCLEVMVQSRQARGLPAPAPDSTRDRAEFEARVEMFLAKLGDDVAAVLDEAQRQSLATAARRAGNDHVARLLAVQATLAKLLPDYWQRFEEVRAAYGAQPQAPDPAPASGRDRPGWLGRLLGG